MTENQLDNEGMPPCPMKNLRSTFSERIRFLRENSNQSLSDVANAIGISKAHVHDMETGRSQNPSLNIIRALSIHFMVPVAALVETEITAQYRTTSQDDLVKRMGWQNISSAPKNKTIWVWDGESVFHAYLDDYGDFRVRNNGDYCYGGYGNDYMIGQGDYPNPVLKWHTADKPAPPVSKDKP